jgi:AcrR family transcriptional regulator
MFSPADPAIDIGHASQRDLAVLRGVGKRGDDSTATVEATLAAVRSLIERDGVIDFNMRELLALAGVSNRAFYRHFPSKEAVVTALVEEVYGTMVHSLAEAVGRASGARARMTAWIDESLRYAHDPGHRARGRIFVAYEARLRDEHPEVYRRAGRALVQQVSAIIRDGVEEGVFTTRSPEEHARIVVRLVVATLQQHVLDRNAPSDVERDALVAFILQACR